MLFHLKSLIKICCFDCFFFCMNQILLGIASAITCFLLIFTTRFFPQVKFILLHFFQAYFFPSFHFQSIIRITMFGFNHCHFCITLIISNILNLLIIHSLFYYFINNSVNFFHIVNYKNSTSRAYDLVTQSFKNIMSIKQ